MDVRVLKNKILKGLGLATPVVLITVFLLFPVISVLISGISDEMGLTGQYLLEVFSNGYYYQLFAFTISQALASTLLSLLIGIPIGYIFGKYSFPGRKFILVLFTVPFVLPTVLVGMGFLVIFGEEGVFGSLFLAIIIAHAFYNIPLVIQYFSAHYQNLDRNIIDAAKTLGYKGPRLFFRIYLPLFLQPILSAGLLTFNFCFLSFGIIFILGQANFRTIEIQIFSEYYNGETNIAAALALMQLLVTITYIIIYLTVARINKSKKTVAETSIFTREQLTWKKIFSGFTSVTLFGVLLIGLTLQLAPIISIIINSFWNPNTKQFTLANYGVIFTLAKNNYLNTSVPRTILNSFLFAIGSAFLATILAIITIIALGKKAKSKLSASYELISYLPLAVSSLTISLGILRSFIFIPFFQKNPWLFIVISHTLLGYPFITRALLNGLNTIGDELEESARTLGAGLFFKLRNVYFPLLTPSLLAGLAFALGLSFGEFTIANFFYRFDSSIATLTVALYKFRDFRLFGESSAVGVLLLITSYLIFFLIELFGGREKTSKKI